MKEIIEEHIAIIENRIRQEEKKATLNYDYNDGLTDGKLSTYAEWLSILKEMKTEIE